MAPIIQEADMRLRHLPAVAAVLVGLVPVVASAGTLAFVVAPPSVTFNVTLTGQNRSATANQALDVSDLTGGNGGWNITATSTTFITGGGSPATLPTSATMIQAAPTTVCDAGSPCTLAINNVPYPYTLPAGTTAPMATKLFNAAVGSGMLNQTVTPTWTLAIPASTYAGTYTSTWTISLVSGP